MTISLCALLAAGIQTPLLAQSGEIRLELGGARSFPPAGTDALEAAYGMIGLTAERAWVGGSALGVSILGGRAVSEFGSDWGSGQIAGDLWTGKELGFGVGLGGRLSAFRVGLPFVYETNTVEFWPQARFSASGWMVLLKGELGRGGSYLAFYRGDRVRRATPDLWHHGGVVEFRTALLDGVFSAGAGVYRGPVGDYSRGFGSYDWYGPVTLQLSAEVWDTPSGTDVSAGLGVRLSLGERWSLRAQGGRGEPDPLIRSPQGRQGGAMLGIRLRSLTSSVRKMVSLVETEGGKKRVRFVMEVDGASVAILGDFSDWEAIPMELDDGKWLIELDLEPGMYHFGFRVDGVWTLPPETPGRISDDWGQENGTVIVPPEEL